MGIEKNKFKSNSVEYSTPPEIFEPLKQEFDIVLDCCASKSNKKCEKYFSQKENALIQDWHKIGNTWMNPPFSKDLKKWVCKAFEESQKGIIVVCLLPVRSNTLWWHKYIIDTNSEVRFLKGEIKFNEMKRGLWLPFAIVIFKPNAPENQKEKVI